MNVLQVNRAYTCKFLYPYDATEETATYAVQLKAPDIGDTRTRGRNQNFARTKSGAVYVYDFGTSLSDMLRLSFTEVFEDERAALLLFLDNVVWGASLIKYIDYKGNERIVRMYKNTVDEVNRGEGKRGVNTTTLYDFTLELVDVTNNPQDSGGNVPSQLAIHIADVDNPHDPRVLVNVAAADGVKVVDTVSVPTVRHASWLVNIHKSSTYSATYFIHATSNISASDATLVGTGTIETLATIGAVPSDVTFSVDLDGAGAAQVMRLKCVKVADDTDLVIRRIKL